MVAISWSMKIYLDTSVISALFDDRNPERKKLTEEFFQEFRGQEICISRITVAEVEKTPDARLRTQMKETLSGFRTLPPMNDVEALAKEYIKMGAIPKEYEEDAYHISVAVLNDMDFILSWNFRHIVRNKTRNIVRAVNSMKNLRTIEIMTPAELL